VLRLGLALAAVLIGFGVAADSDPAVLRIHPVLTRAQGYHGFEGSTSVSQIPWNHVPEFFLRWLRGARETYGARTRSSCTRSTWPARGGARRAGTDGARAPTVALWAGGIGLLFLLNQSRSGHPILQALVGSHAAGEKTRAPGMAFYVVALVTCRVRRSRRRRALKGGGRRVMTPR